MEMFIPYIWSKLGACSACMRKAFAIAAATWLGLGLIFALTSAPLPRQAATVLAIGTTALWLAHIVAFSAKWIGRRPALESRRAAISAIAGAAVGAALISIWPRLAFAGPTLIECRCTGGGVTSGCCPSENGNVCDCSNPKNPVIRCGEGPVTYGVCN